MDLEGNVQERLKKENFGFFRVRLKKEYNLEWYLFGEQKTMRAVKKRNNNSNNNATVVGIYNEQEQLSEKGFTLKVVEPLNVTSFIPYEAIEDFTKLVPERKNYHPLRAPNNH